MPDIDQSGERCYAALCIMLHLSCMAASPAACMFWCLSVLHLPLLVCTSAFLFPSHKCCFANERLAVLRGLDRQFNIDQSQTSHLYSFRASLQTSIGQTLGYVQSSKLLQPTHLLLKSPILLSV